MCSQSQYDIDMKERDLQKKEEVGVGRVENFNLNEDRSIALHCNYLL